MTQVALPPNDTGTVLGVVERAPQTIYRCAGRWSFAGLRHEALNPNGVLGARRERPVACELGAVVPKVLKP